MNYISTRDNYRSVQAAEAIRLGMVPAGGLFVPEEIPEITLQELEEMQDDSYQELAYRILSKYLTDFTLEELQVTVNKAYNRETFPHLDITPLVKLADDIFILELWHGPTAAFKDLALQLLPYLMVQAVNKTEMDNEIVILVATSGDTGKAALEGFRDVEGIRIIVFYPDGGVSKIQEAQMVTTGGDNTSVVAVEGNFDDCQNAVKDVFGDLNFNQKLNQQGYQFSSANSINWGRLVPQIVYYFSAYKSLVQNEEIKTGDKINITVPTGNFGNILAGYYAYRMGLPVNKYICASNENNILTDFLNTGVYNLKREFHKTISPSMDILLSSNLERFLFMITGNNGQKVSKWYDELKNKGKFTVGQETLKKMQTIFAGEFSTEQETRKTIKETAEKYDYLVDPHTAVGIKSYKKYLQRIGETEMPVVIDSTANPYKFSRAVLNSLKGKVDIEDDFALLAELHQESGMEIHRALRSLDQAAIKHQRNCRGTEIRQEIEDILSLS